MHTTITYKHVNKCVCTNIVEKERQLPRILINTPICYDYQQDQSPGYFPM